MTNSEIDQAFAENAFKESALKPRLQTYKFAKFMPYYHGWTIQAESLIDATKELHRVCGSDWNLTWRYKLQSITK